MFINNTGEFRGKAKRFKKTIILLEDEKQVKNCLKRFKQITGQKLIIAASPFAMHALDQKNIQYKIPEDYYTPMELSKVGEVTHRKVEKLCDTLDKILRREIPELKRAGLYPAKYHIPQLIMCFDTLMLRVFQLQKIFDFEQPEIVYAFDTRQYPYGTYGFCFDNRELLYGKLLSLPGWGVQTAVMRTPPQKDSKGEKGKIYAFEKKIYELLASWPNTFYAVDALRRHSLGGAVSLLGKSLLAKSKLNVLSLDLGYDTSYCYKTFLDQGIFLSYLKDKSYAWAHGKKLDPNVISRITNCLNRKDIRKYFVCGGVDIYPLLRERLEFLITQGVPACLAAFEETSNVIKTRKIKAVLAPYFVTPTSHSIANAARNLGVPVFTWFHGARLSEHATIHYMELMSSDVCMSYGAVLPKDYLRCAKRWKTRIVSVGSSRLDYIKKGVELSENAFQEKYNNRTRLVYATNSYYQNDFYFGIFPPPSDNMVYRTQLETIDGIGGLDNVEVTVKLFPGSHYQDPPLREYAETKGYKNMKWVKNVPSFVDLLDHCDVVVLDFASTPLIEAIAAGKPVFLLTKHLKIWKDTLKLLKRRVACFEHESELIRSLKSYIQTGLYPADLSDDEFLRACCTCSNDGKSCERAAAEIIKAIYRQAKNFKATPKY